MLVVAASNDQGLCMFIVFFSLEHLPVVTSFVITAGNSINFASNN